MEEKGKINSKFEKLTKTKFYAVEVFPKITPTTRRRTCLNQSFPHILH